MRLFKKKEEKVSCCTVKCHEENKIKIFEKKNQGARIKVLGSGCAKCKALEKSVKEALEKLGRNEEIEHVIEFSEIASYGVMSTPALVVDEQVVSFGKVLNSTEVIHLLNKIGF